MMYDLVQGSEAIDGRGHTDCAASLQAKRQRHLSLTVAA